MYMHIEGYEYNASSPPYVPFFTERFSTTLQMFGHFLSRLLSLLPRIHKRELFDDVEVEDESSRSFTSGVRSKFPSRGGVFRSMNLHGRRERVICLAKCCRTISRIRQGNNTTLPSRASSSQTANWSSPDLKDDRSCEYAGKKAINTYDIMGTRPLEPTALLNTRMYPPSKGLTGMEDMLIARVKSNLQFR